MFMMIHGLVTGTDQDISDDENDVNDQLIKSPSSASFSMKTSEVARLRKKKAGRDISLT
jgi:hypothetical protein